MFALADIWAARTTEAVTLVSANDHIHARGSAHYDGRAIDAQKSPFVPDKLDPERVLADMQLALWPLPAVQAAFRERGLTVTEPFAGLRRLTRGDALLAEVHYATGDPWSGRLWFVNFEFDYSLTIDTTTN